MPIPDTLLMEKMRRVEFGLGHLVNTVLRRLGLEMSYFPQGSSLMGNRPCRCRVLQFQFLRRQLAIF